MIDDFDFIQSILKNDNELIKELIKQGANVNAKDLDGNTPLHFASCHNNPEIIKLLIEKGAKVNAKSNNKNTPLHLAIDYNNIEIITLLLNQEADVKAEGNNKNTPLHLASCHDNLEIIKLLIKKGSEVNAKDLDGDTPLHLASCHNNPEIIKLLIEKGANVNAKSYDKDTPLHLAIIDHNNIEIITLLLNQEADVNAEDNNKNTPLHLASCHDNLEIIKLLIKKGAKVNAKDLNGNTPLHFAIDKNKFEIIKLLIENGANVNEEDNNKDTPLHWASCHNNPEIIKLLIEKGAKVNVENQKKVTPLHLAIYKDNSEIAKLLIDKGASIDEKDKNKDTPLHMATYKGNSEIAKLLINNNADINKKGHNNLTPLHLAVNKNNPEIIELLINKKVNINAQDNKGRAPLHLAISQKDYGNATLLINNNADVNVRNSHGHTPLHFAINKNNPEIIELLINKKANIDAQDNEGQTPLHFAINQKDYENATLLINKNANVNVLNSRGHTPLHLAIQQKDVEIINILFKNEPNFKKDSLYLFYGDYNFSEMLALKKEYKDTIIKNTIPLINITNHFKESIDNSFLQKNDNYQKSNININFEEENNENSIYTEAQRNRLSNAMESIFNHPLDDAQITNIYKAITKITDEDVQDLKQQAINAIEVENNPLTIEKSLQEFIITYCEKYKNSKKNDVPKIIEEILKNLERTNMLLNNFTQVTDEDKVFPGSLEEIRLFFNGDTSGSRNTVNSKNELIALFQQQYGATKVHNAFLDASNHCVANLASILRIELYKNIFKDSSMNQDMYKILHNNILMPIISDNSYSFNTHHHHLEQDLIYKHYHIYVPNLFKTLKDNNVSGSIGKLGFSNYSVDFLDSVITKEWMDDATTYSSELYSYLLLTTYNKSLFSEKLDKSFLSENVKKCLERIEVIEKFDKALSDSLEKENIKIEEFQFTDDKKINVILDESSKLDEDIIPIIREKVGQDIEISYNSISKNTLSPIITDININNVSRLETSQHLK